MILVTGGTGLVGSHLLFQLTQKEDSVRAIFRTEASRDKVKEVFGYYTDEPKKQFDKIDWVQADITDVPSMIPVFENVTEVYHAAALISFDPKDYIRMRKANIHGTAIVVNLSIDAGVKKLCYVSSIAAIGENPSKKTIDEENEWNDNENNHGYAITKYGGEMEVWRASQEGIDVVIVNPGVILGPGYWSSGSGKLFSQVAKGFTFYTEGVTGFIDVMDVVNAMMKLMKSSLKNERYILVSENKTFKDVLTNIAEALKVKKPTKKIKPFVSSLFWRFEAIKSFFTNKGPRMTKHSAKSLHSKSFYNNEKVIKAIDMKFKSVDQSILETAKRFIV